MWRTDGVVIGGRPLSHRAAIGKHGRLLAVDLRGPERRRLHGARNDHQLLDLGRPGRDQEPAGGRRCLPRGQPEDHGQGHRVGLGHVLGQAPDRDRRRRRAGRLRDGRPALPGLPVAGRPDLKPFIDRDGYDLSQLADQAVADFTTPGGQFGLPRDLNVVALYYNKAMFDAAGVPYPDASWDWAKLVEVAHKLTLDTNSDGKPDQWGFYTETSDMENYWSSLVWQNGGDILAPDGKSTVLGTDQAVGGIQFLQDLIWKEKVMPDPALFAEIGDAFEQGKAAMEANGSWLVATHQAAGIDFGIAPLPKGPAGQATSINPTGAVVYAKTKSPDAAWEFVKYLASPAAQTKLMELRASLPANKAVLAGPFASSFDGAKVLADAISYAHIKPSFKGYNDFATTLQTELDANVFSAPNKTARQAIDAVLPALNALLAGK